MSIDQLSIFDPSQFDDTIIKKELRTYLPYLSNKFQASDQIRIPIHSEELYLDISNSFLHLEGTFTGGTNVDHSQFTNNAFTFLFAEMQYYLNQKCIETVRDPGIVSTIKNLTTMRESEKNANEIMGWSSTFGAPSTVVGNSFSACVPLKKIFGLMETYNKIFINARHELVLTRSRVDTDCFKGAGDLVISLDKVEWCVWHITVNDAIKYKILGALNSAMSLEIPFRSWSLFELPAMKPNKNDIWTVKSFTNLQRPRFILIAFQTNKRDNKEKDVTDFDHCSIRDIKCWINNSVFPYEKLNLDFTNGKYIKAYQMYLDFQRSYNNNEITEPILSYETFKNKVVYVIDCKHQDDTIKLSSCDLKIEMEADTPFPANTKCYAIIIHDSLFTYNPLTSTVVEIIN